MADQFDVQMTPVDFGRGVVMTVFDKKTQRYIAPEGWSHRQQPVPFLVTTGSMNLEEFKSLIHAIIDAYFEFLAVEVGPKIKNSLKDAFDDEVAKARQDDPPAVGGSSDEGDQG